MNIQPSVVCKASLLCFRLAGISYTLQVLKSILLILVDQLIIECVQLIMIQFDNFVLT